MNRGKVYFVDGTMVEQGQVDPKTAHIMSSADVVLHEASASPILLALIRPSASEHNVGVVGAISSMTQEEICSRMVAYATEGFTVVRLKGNDPSNDRRTRKEMFVLRACGIKFEVLSAGSAGQRQESHPLHVAA
jgi:uroporphyrin-III C-methyltransferase